MLSVRLKIAFFFSILVVSPGLQAENIDFARDIRPVFAEHCTTCHGPDEQKGGLNLTREKSLHGKLKSGEPALVPGKTDEIGWSIEENPVHPNDLQATLLHCFGLDHKKLTYRFQGRDFRLTDVAGRVMKDWIS